MASQLNKYLVLAIKLFAVPLSMLLIPVAKFIPKKSNRWVFGEWAGQRYCDNSRFLFEYVASSTDVDAVWITRNRAILADLRSRRLRAYHAFSIKGFLACATADWVVCAHSIYDVNRVGAYWAKKAMLWHGSPFKRIGADCATSRFKAARERLKDRIFPHLSPQWDIVFATSPYFAARMKSAFGGLARHVVIAGYPRNDVLLSGRSRPKRHRKNVLFAPSWRRSIADNLDIFRGITDERVLRLLRDKEMTLTLKVHGAVYGFLSPRLKMIRSIAPQVVVDLDENNFSEVLSGADVLISDMSGAIADFCLLGRPIIHYFPDIAGYENGDAGLYSPIEEWACGPICQSTDELCRELEKASVVSEIHFEKNRRNFHIDTDGQFSRKAFEAIACVSGQAEQAGRDRRW